MSKAFWLGVSHRTQIDLRLERLHLLLCSSENVSFAARGSLETPNQNDKLVVKGRQGLPRRQLVVLWGSLEAYARKPSFGGWIFLRQLLRIQVVEVGLVGRFELRHVDRIEIGFDG